MSGSGDESSEGNEGENDGSEESKDGDGLDRHEDDGSDDNDEGAGPGMNQETRLAGGGKPFGCPLRKGDNDKFNFRDFPKCVEPFKDFVAVKCVANFDCSSVIEAQGPFLTTEAQETSQKRPRVET